LPDGERADLNERTKNTYQGSKEHGFNKTTKHFYDERRCRLRHMLITINDARKLILSGQCLLEKDKNQVVQVVSDLSGIQYDPCPILHLNHYLVLWSRVPDFKVTDYDRIAYVEMELVEASLFKRNLFIAPTCELDIYNAATERIVRWGKSREQQKCKRQSGSFRKWLKIMISGQ